MSKGQFCQQKGHLDNPRNICCTNQHCPKQGIICAHCLLQDHNDHVKQCIPLKEIIKSLNKANNAKIIEDLGNSGCDILKQHKQIIIGFKSYITKLKRSIENIENAIEQQMKRLLEEADVFVGDAFEVLLEKINEPVLNLNEIEQDINKFSSMISIGYNGEIETLNDQLRNKEIDRIMQNSILLDREARYWMQKCTDDLNSLKDKLLDVKFEAPKQFQSDDRFGYIIDNWTMEGTNAITFQQSENMSKRDMWLTGIGIFDILNISNLPSLPKFTISLCEGQTVEQKPILKQEFEISHETIKFKNKMGTLYLDRALKLNPKYQYTISITTDQPFVTHAGMNGCVNAKDFTYSNSLIESTFINNGTSTFIGQIPYLTYEVI